MLGVIVVEVIAPGFLLNVRNQLENLFFENVKKKNEMKLTDFPAKINYFENFNLKKGFKFIKVSISQKEMNLQSSNLVLVLHQRKALTKRHLRRGFCCIKARLLL
jgi:hypothetical protein